MVNSSLRLLRKTSASSIEHSQLHTTTTAKMSLLLSSLPAPTREYTSRKAATAAETDDAQLASTPQSSVPPYGKRKGYIPRKDADFGGGGAFPEILMAQYPLGMGRKDKSAAATSKTLALTTNAEGDIQYDVILKQGKNKDKIIASEHKALVPKIDRIAKGEVCVVEHLDRAFSAYFC